MRALTCLACSAFAQTCTSWVKNGMYACDKSCSTSAVRWNSWNGLVVPACGRKQLTALLKEHISIAVDLIKAAKAGDKAGQQSADAKWQQNGVAIADFLSKANPHWPRATLVDLMKGHLSTTTNEVVSRLNKKWDEDVRAFDEVYRHILMMSDALSDGIVKQFPDKFAD